MHLSPEVNLLAVAHYLQALEYQRYANQIVAILGGKTPNIQNLAVGGVANAINLDNQATLNMDKLFMIKTCSTSSRVRPGSVFRRCLRGRCNVSRLVQLWRRRHQLPRCSRPPSRYRDDQFDLPGGIVFDGKLDAVYPIKNHTDQRSSRRHGKRISRLV